MGTKHFWSPQIPQNLRIYVDDLICRDLRAFGGTSLDHKFLVGGPKSIYTTGPFGPVGPIRQCSLVFVGVHRCSSMFVGVRRCPKVFVDVRWCLPVSVGVHLCLSVFVGVHWSPLLLVSVRLFLLVFAGP